MFVERLWPSAPIIALAVPAPFAFGLAFLPLGLAWSVGAGIVAAVGIAIGLVRASAVIAVRDGQLHAGPAHIPLEFLREPTAVAAADRSATLGRYLDARAFVLLRSWVPTMVRVDVVDPADPTPYWLVSTRRPEELVAALSGGAAN